MLNHMNALKGVTKMKKQLTEKEMMQAAIDRAMEDPTFQDMASIVGKEITEHAVFISILSAGLQSELDKFPDFQKKMEELKARRIVFKGNLSNIIQ